jgi:hypothetical protein
MAAGYCGEPDVPAFLERVAAGQYPKPYLIESIKRKFWLKKELDVAMGLEPEYEEEVPIKSMGDRFVASKKRERKSGFA